MGSLGVMHMVDALSVGGAERIAVDLANNLPREEFEVHLCATRRGGPLEAEIASHVRFLVLGRRSRMDLKALARLSRYLHRYDVRILHAHSTSLFTAVLASFLPPFPRVVWHAHSGAWATETRCALVYGPLARRASGVIAVNDRLAQWARDALCVRADRVWYIPNFVSADLSTRRKACNDLPGRPGRRVLCVAGIRPQKDMLTLLRAFARVRREVPDAVLLVVGDVRDEEYFRVVRRAQEELELVEGVHWLGQRLDARDIMMACDVGVLSSVSEGLPVALLEYGAAGLAAVCTDVGQCREVLDGGTVGILVPPGNHEAVAQGIVRLLCNEGLRKELGSALRRVVAERYRVKSAVERVAKVYREVAI